MIPVRLKMRNFMPYKGDTPELSFTGFHTACISGDNGAGKSSIVDAITWALWGKARAKSNDELVHQGETEMEVEFDFLVGEQFFRVIRKYALPRSTKAAGQSSLDLFVASGDSFIPISADSKTQTECLISGKLHMDYDTFVNSAYLRQSHADEFTRQAPAKRKEVLARILNLDMYDEFEKDAREKARNAAQNRRMLADGINEIAAELEAEPAVNDQLQEQCQQLATLNRELASVSLEAGDFKKKLAELDHIRSRFEQFERNIKRYRDDQLREKTQQQEAESRAGQYRRLIDQQAAIKADFEKYSQAVQAYETTNQKAREAASLSSRMAKYEIAIAQAQSNLMSDHRQSAAKLEAFQKQETVAAEARQRLEELAQEKLENGKLKIAADSLRQQSMALNTAIAAGKAESARLESEILDIQDKLKLLDAETGSEAICPLCETELAEHKLALVKEKYTCDRQAKHDRIKLIQDETAARVRQVKALEAEISAQENAFAQKDALLRNSQARLDHSINQGAEASRQIAAEKKVLDEIERKLAVKDFAAPEQTALAALRADLAALGYDEEKHDSLRVMVNEMKDCERQQHALEEALRLLPREEETIARALSAVGEYERRIAEDEAGSSLLTSQLAVLPEVAGQYEAAAAAQKELTARRDEALQLKARLEQKQAHLAEMHARVKLKQQELDKVSQEVTIFEQLAHIFGKKGIQAALIETALPEIEDEANRLLSRMTDNRMHLSFETQKQTKKGDTAETLDIVIGDELGTRDYNLFSGGEAFRIDFSIRIALARLLARRAGAPLPTLIIDEGFGTQDADGIDKLKEAINSIQNDFQKIIVITHIEELKDAFPTRINVVKKDEGSVIELS